MKHVLRICIAIYALFRSLPPANTQCGAPCENGGVCSQNTCECDGTGYEGGTCSFDINECATLNYCTNGDCTNSPGGYSCECYSGYSGDRCNSGSGAAAESEAFSLFGLELFGLSFTEVVVVGTGVGFIVFSLLVALICCAIQDSDGGGRGSDSSISSDGPLDDEDDPIYDGRGSIASGWSTATGISGAGGFDDPGFASASAATFGYPQQDVVFDEFGNTMV